MSHLSEFFVVLVAVSHLSEFFGSADFLFVDTGDCESEVRIMYPPLPGRGMGGGGGSVPSK